MRHPEQASAVERIGAMIEPALESMGFSLVQIRFTDGGGKRTLQVMAEPLKMRLMTVDDCADISRVVSAMLDAEDPVQGAYDLEVSSPGIARPLVKLKDYERFAGHDIKLETVLPIEGRRRFKGMLLGAEEGVIRLETEQGETMLLAFDNIQSASLVLTDELVKEYLQQHKKRNKK